MVKESEMCVTKRPNCLLTIIRRSCITGKVVWIYRGPSEEAARKAYYRACKKEVMRVRHWKDTVKKRMENIARLLTNCMADLPINAELTSEQKDAAKQLKTLSLQEIPCHTDFYEHIVEEGRRRNAASSRWRENRNKLFGRKEMNRKKAKL